MQLTKTLLAWYAKHGRHDLPWRKTRNSYNILVSELMLQQTQVSRVIPKYKAFLKKFPTIHVLAASGRTDVLQAWQGLGYNSRAVRLHSLARLVVDQYDGTLPDQYELLLKLPGIGPYTAGAIIIFSHDTHAPSVDVNVARVVKRLLYTIRQHPLHKEIDGRALQLLRESGRPHDWHSAVMDFGSAVCTAQRPACLTCPLHKYCKSQGVRPDEQRKKKTERFRGSNRWWRGRILKQLLNGTVSKRRLLLNIVAEPSEKDKELYEKAVVSMIDENVVRQERTYLKIVE